MNSQSQHKILFITSNLGGGGAERALVNIVNNIDRSLFEPYLVLFQKEGPYLNDLSPDVQIYEIQPKNYGFLYRNWVRINAIKNICDSIKPSLVMSVLWQVNIVSIITASFRKIKIPFLANEQNTPSKELQSLWQRYLYWPLAKRLYHYFQGVVAISSGIANEIEMILSYPNDKISIIPNPIDIEKINYFANKTLTETLRTPSLISVGRLVPQKNHKLLIRAIKYVIREFPVHLYLIGEGIERKKLEKEVKNLKLSSHVHFLGFQSNPYNFVKSSDLFVLPSNFEGFGNVIVEALAVSTPVISTDCPNGPREILRDGKYGVLVPVSDEKELADAILTLLRSSEKRRYFSEVGRKRSEDFSTRNIIPIYEELFLRTISNYENY